MPTGRVEALYVTPESGADMRPRDAVEAVAERGLRGDRYFEGVGLWNAIEENREGAEASDVTLIERETLDAIERDYDVSFAPGEHRRNVTTQDVPLNHLVGRRFRVGDAVCEGMGLCEPCGYLQSITGQEAAGEALKHRGGLDARVVESGGIAVGDEVTW